MGKVSKQWRTDGEEDNELHALIKKGKINKYTSPKDLQKDYPDIFGAFSLQVMRNHLNAAKRLNGLYLDTSEDNELFDLQEKVDVKVPETARASGATTSGFNAPLAAPLSAPLAHQNYPTIITRYICPETETEKVLLAATVPAGAQNLGVELHEDGFGVSIKYSWPKVMYNTDDLFKKKLQTQGYHAYHPMILSFKNGLEQIRKKIDVAPKGLINIVLPVKVQTGIGSWEKWGAKREDGSHVLLAAFSCNVKDYVKKVSDESVVYD